MTKRLIYHYQTSVQHLSRNELNMRDTKVRDTKSAALWSTF